MPQQTRRRMPAHLPVRQTRQSMVGGLQWLMSGSKAHVPASSPSQTQRHMGQTEFEYWLNRLHLQFGGDANAVAEMIKGALSGGKSQISLLTVVMGGESGQVRAFLNQITSSGNILSYLKVMDLRVQPYF
ncbi:unnamed protein product [Protopolystoma xenopodis]|uniref:Uncharacterized protein n=1 Tax=Protopolystoma xenopodis TaxID=117903 RepID=A0A448WTS0_9PLAT|nr:unnamed protein product [Protopolystoma xenopodis]